MFRLFVPALLALLLTPHAVQAQDAPQDCGTLSVAECRIQALRLQFGFGVEQNLMGALNLFDDACLQGDGVSCTEVGVIFQLGIGAIRDEDAALLSLQQGCTPDLVEQCRDHGLSYLDASSPVQNLVKAEVILAQACWAGSPRACVTVARINRSGDNGKDQLIGMPDSIRFYREACELGLAVGCEEGVTLIAEREELALYQDAGISMRIKGCAQHGTQALCDDS